VAAILLSAEGETAGPWVPLRNIPILGIVAKARKEERVDNLSLRGS
jgi:hypothetical protein